VESEWQNKTRIRCVRSDASRHGHNHKMPEIEPGARQRAAPTLRRSASAALRQASPIEIASSTVVACLNLDDEADQHFELAWRSRLGGGNGRLGGGALSGTTGHIAESVVEISLAERGYVPLAHHPGPGRHGVDLLMLHFTTELVVAFEVKGTLRRGFVPRLTRGDLAQMSSAWLDKPDNPAMTSSALRSEDIFGAVAVLNFPDLTLRVAFTGDFANFRPVLGKTELADPSAIGLQELCRE
jgi:hypothetical protein